MSLQNARTGYSVGYGKPPLHTRFTKGKSGNPRGRPPGATSLSRAKALALAEAYRLVIVKEGRKEATMPAIQAVLRCQMALAAQGNGPAQRAVIAAVLAIEAEGAQLAAEREAREAELNKPQDLIDAARRICHLLRISREQEDVLIGRTPPQGAAGATAPAGAAAAVPDTPTSAGTPCASAPCAGTSPADGAPACSSAVMPAAAPMPDGRVCEAQASAQSMRPGRVMDSGLSTLGLRPTVEPRNDRAVDSNFKTTPAPAGVAPAGAASADAALAGAALAGAASAGAPSPRRPRADELPATTRRASWRERLSPEAMLWRGEEPPPRRNRFGIGGERVWPSGAW